PPSAEWNCEPEEDRDNKWRRLPLEVVDRGRTILVRSGGFASRDDAESKPRSRTYLPLRLWSGCSGVGVPRSGLDPDLPLAPGQRQRRISTTQQKWRLHGQNHRDERPEGGPARASSARR